LAVSFVDEHMEFEGVTFVSWLGQQQGSGSTQANGIPISLALYNEIRNAAAIFIPILLNAVDVANNRNVALVLD
jgi:hypothetical protein